MSKPEEWRDIVGFEGRYQVSDCGRVRSIGRYVPYPDGRKSRWMPARIMRTPVNKSGYPVVQLQIDSHYMNRLVHLLMLRAFVGPAPEGMIARHLDSNPGNCTLANVVWGTRSENEMDKVDNGTSNRGERHGMAVLTEADARQIKALLEAKVTQSEIAKRFGVHQVHISKIKRGLCWGWL